jgi:glycosyltransferase involved in cell wall biosynthesis
MRTGVILDGNFLTDQRVINEVNILEKAGHSIFILNIPAVDTLPVTEYSKSTSMIKVSFSKKTDNYLFAFENLVPLYDFFWYREIKALAEMFKVEILHAHDLYLAKAAGQVAKDLKIPLILDLHENYPAAINEYQWANRLPARLFVKPGRWRKKEKKYLSFADRIILLSGNFRDNLILKYPEIDRSRIFIYPNVPDTAKLLSYKINKNVFQSEDKEIVFYFGVISRRRGIHTAIQALETLLPSHPGLHLLLIGPVDKAEKDEFMKLFLKDTLKDHLTHYPWRDINEFPSFVECSQICISPLLKNAQHESGVANKIFQYMLFGKPLLVSDCTPQVEIVDKTGCGLVFKNGDPTDMGLKLSELLSDPGLRERLGENGRKAVLEEYNTDIQGAEIIKAYASQEINKG